MSEQVNSCDHKDKVANLADRFMDWKGYDCPYCEIERLRTPLPALKNLLLPIELDHLIEWHRMLAGCAEQTDNFAAARRSRERGLELFGIRAGDALTKGAD